MIAASKIWIRRAEGRTAELEEREVATFAEAAGVLARWSRTAPEGGGYHKCDFVITFADGETYEGRFDLSRDGSKDLAAHVRGFLTFYAGTGRPAHLSEERYRAFLASVEERGTGAKARAFLETYAIGDEVAS